MAAFETWSFDEPCKSMSSPTALSQAEVVCGSDEDDDSIVNMEGFDLVFVCHYADDSAFPVEPKVMDDKAANVLLKFLEESREDYSAKLGSTTPTLRMMDAKNKCQRYVLVGLREKDDAQQDDNDDNTMGRSLGKAIAAKCAEEAAPQVRNAVVVLPERLPDNFYMNLSASFYSSLYTDNRFRGTLHTIKKPKIAANHLKRLEVWPFAAGVQETIDAGKAIAKGVCLSRDIVNAPHNVLNSLSLADLARTIASESKDGCITCQILDKDECEKRGMGAYLGVARASETPPQFIHLTYTPPNGAAKKTVGVVGKGLLFDTGGYNIKTAMMELMKFDCGGAAAVLGAASVIGSLRPEGVQCHFVIAACENMINDRGIVPSDVLVASNGVTIEVANTDAEGRLTLADALVYCDKELGCEKIIELSTLTGACMVALGKEVCGVFTENDDLAKELESVSSVTGESSWRMPLVKSYEEQLKSKIADINNYGTRFGGAITAGLFLQHFVDTKRVPFAHIDIAGPVWDDKSGATGFGAKLVSEWISRQGTQQEEA